MNTRLNILLSVLLLIALAIVVYIGSRTPALAAVVAGTASAPAVSQALQVSQPASLSGITVTAEGEARAQPDMATVNIGVQTEGSTAEEAMAKNRQLMSTVLAKIKNVGIADKDIQTSSINVFPEMEPPKPNETGQPKISGYRAMNSVTVRVLDIAKAGPVLDAAIAGGANQMYGIQFGLQDPSALQTEALTAAVKAARVKADAIAKAAGLQIKGIAAISEDFIQRPMPLGEAAAPMAREAQTSTPVQPGELRVTAQVRVTYTY